jgi:hypothetical protein
LDHEVTLKAPLPGSGWREYSYGGFGGGHRTSIKREIKSIIWLVMYSL